MLDAKCPHCRSTLKGDDRFAGQMVNCPDCKKPFRAPLGKKQQPSDEGVTKPPQKKNSTIISAVDDFIDRSGLSNDFGVLFKRVVFFTIAIPSAAFIISASLYSYRVVREMWRDAVSVAESRVPKVPSKPAYRIYEPDRRQLDQVAQVESPAKDSAAYTSTENDSNYSSKPDYSSNSVPIENSPIAQVETAQPKTEDAFPFGSPMNAVENQAEPPIWIQPAQHATSTDAPEETKKYADTLTLPSGSKFNTDIFSIGDVDWSRIFPYGCQFYAERQSYGSLRIMASRAAGTGILDGVAVQLHENRNLKTIASYKRGLLTDELRIWEPNGEQRYFAQYRNGKKDGVVCLFRNGKPWMFQEFKEGKLEAEGMAEGASGVLEEAKKILAAVEKEQKNDDQDLHKKVRDFPSSIKEKIAKESIGIKGTAIAGQAKALAKQREVRLMAEMEDTRRFAIDSLNRSKPAPVKSKSQF